VFVLCLKGIPAKEALSTSTASSATVLAILRVDLQKNGIEIETRLDERNPAIEGDMVQLQQVILNIVMNASEAMQSVQPRRLKVQSGQSKSGTIRVLVQDTGTGIDAANIARIFDALFTTKSGGMGMGLSICRSIIEAHGGRIWVSPACSATNPLIVAQHRRPFEARSFNLNYRQRSAKRGSVRAPLRVNRDETGASEHLFRE
jgi:C4-dicarboxylate-specific signal transduction histidine kinase